MLLQSSDPQFICFPKNLSRAYPAAGEPHAICLNVVITTNRRSNFAHWRSAKFPTPNDERLVQEAALFQVAH